MLNTSFFISDAYAVLGPLFAFIVIFGVLPIVAQVLLINRFDDDFKTALETCENRDDSIPYGESKAYELLEDLDINWNFSISKQRSLDCVRYAKGESKKVGTPTAKKILNLCRIANKLTTCMDNYKSGARKRLVNNASRSITPYKNTGDFNSVQKRRGSSVIAK